MNILIPHSWLEEYLETKVKPKKIAECLSLCGASVEKIIKKDNDFIYEIEITSNRVDMAGIATIAREAAAILPQFGISTKFKNDPYRQYATSTSKKRTRHLRGGRMDSSEMKEKKQSTPLKLTIKDQKLCPRFTAVLLNQVKIKASPKIIKERLEKVNLRSLNNAIDISNYLMHELGQPVHVFDYDKIGKATMILRESKSGEKITTLDGKTHNLSGDDIIIEDGKKRLIDLCGIMGGENSCVDQNTKRVLLFVQNYEPSHIRRTSMILGQRTEAASLFEKGIDPELVMPTILKGIELFKKYAGATVASKIIDIYPKPYKPKNLKISLSLINQRIGVKIQLNKVLKILSSLGFQPKQSTINYQQLTINIPSWRANDISIPEDLIEEIARIYGYHNLPSILPSGKLPEKILDKTFYLEEKVKNLLKGWGLAETYTYSMQSLKQLQKFNLDPENHLKISNPLTEDWVYMRTSLIPPLLSVIAENQPHQKQIKIFELSNIYQPQTRKLPQEIPHLIIAFTGEKFYCLKGILEALFEELNIPITNYQLLITDQNQFHPQRSAEIYSGKSLLGIIGEIHPQILQRFNIEKRVTVIDLDFRKLVVLASDKKTYQSIPEYPPIIEEMTFELPRKTLVGKLMEEVKAVDNLIHSIKLVDTFGYKKTFQITYQQPKKSLKSKDIKPLRQKIVQKVESKFFGKFFGKLE